MTSKLQLAQMTSYFQKLTLTNELLLPKSSPPVAKHLLRSPLA